MSMFNGNLSTRETEYHSFVSDDLALEAIGMCAYTKSSMSAYLNPNNSDIVSYFDNKLNDNKAALLASDENKLLEKYSIMRFDKDTKKYTLVTGADIFKKSDGTSVPTINSIDTLLTRHNDIQRGGTATLGEVEVIKNIQISLSGCITFRPKLNILNCERTPLVRLYVKNRTNNNTSRSLANNGPPMIVAVPSRVTGNTYAYHDTSNLPIGVYSNPQHDGASNPANAIASELKLTYNSALGKFESGTQQMLARLLSDVDAAELTSIADILDQIDNATPDDFINPESSLYMGQFKTGIALPLTSENGNPHHFGPNMVGCAENNKKEKILVVNRSPRPFKAGDVVICNQIGGEWIIQGFDTPTIQDPKKTGIKTGRWSFNKWIANSDYFFRDKNYTIQENGNYLNNTLYTPDLYESKFRYRYYLSLSPDLNQESKGFNDPSFANDLDLRKIALINIYQNLNNFNESSIAAALATSPGAEQFKDQYNFSFEGYNLETVFSQVNAKMRGTNDKTIFSRTNPYALTAGIDQFYMFELAGFWGPVFPEGYNSQQCANLKTSNAQIFGQEGQAEDLHAKANDKILFDPESNDQFLYHLPAEIATNGPFVEKKLTSPRETFIGFIDSLKEDFTQSNLFESISNYLTGERYDIKKDINNNTLYGLEPISTNKITFIPLSLEMMAYNYNPSAYQTPGSPVNQEYSTYLTKYKYIKDAFLGLFSNNTDLDIQLLEDVINSNYRAIGVDTKKDGNGPIGGPDLLPDTEAGNEKSNMVGIIGAKNTFSGNGFITFTTRQYFGLPKIQKSAGGQAGSITILPIGGGVGWVGPSNPTLQYGFPQWGNSIDNYNSFGTTALHVRIFEAWPEEQTIYDSRYFAVLHFNPGSLFQEVETQVVDSGITIQDWAKEDGVGELNGLKYERSVDKIMYDVDFRVPTVGHPNDSNLDNKLVPEGSIIDRNGTTNGAVLRPPSEWRVCAVRRGQLLTKGGFRYFKRVIGLSNGPNAQFTIIDRGTKYKKDQEIILTKGAKIKVTVGDSGNIININIIDQGVGFMPSDFANKYELNGSDIYGYIATLKAEADGTPAKIMFHNGIVYDKLYIDEGPLELTLNPVRLTLPSNRGESAAEGTLTTTISLEGSTKKNFNAFYFFHNDILHTISISSLSPFTPGFGQYVTLEIGAG